VKQSSRNRRKSANNNHNNGFKVLKNNIKQLNYRLRKIRRGLAKLDKFMLSE